MSPMGAIPVKTGPASVPLHELSPLPGMLFPQKTSCHLGLRESVTCAEMPSLSTLVTVTCIQLCREVAASEMTSSLVYLTWQVVGTE